MNHVEIWNSHRNVVSLPKNIKNESSHPTCCPRQRNHRRPSKKQDSTGFSNKSKGFGFVVMPNRPEAEKAIAAMSEKEVMGRKMRVNEAHNTIKADA